MVDVLQIVVALGTLLVSYIGYFVFDIYYNNFWKFRCVTSKVPGLPWRPLTGMTHHMPRDRTKIPAYWLGMQKQFRDAKMSVFYLGPYLTVDLWHPSLFQIVLSSSKHTKKAPVAYSLIRDWLNDGLLLAYGPKWHQRRHMITPTFHFEILSQFVEIMNERTADFVDKLAVKSQGQEDIDVFKYITLCALDIIAETAMGINVEAMTSDEKENEYVKAVYAMSANAITRLLNPLLLIETVHNLSATGRQFRKDLKTLHDYTQRVIENRRAKLYAKEDEQVPNTKEGRAPRKAFLDFLLAWRDPETGQPLSDKDIREEVDTFLFEGHDTTAAGIAWTLYLIGKHPDVQARLHQEIDDLYDSIPEGDHVTIDHLRTRVPYLDRVLQESLRVYPSVPTIGRELTEDVVVGDVTLPKGLNVMLPIYAMNRNPDVWENPDVFDPDRWLPERVKASNINVYAYVPFSAGPRNCIGQKFAHYEEQIVVMQVLRRFHIQTTREAPAVPELILRPIEGVHLKLTPRSHD